MKAMSHLNVGPSAAGVAIVLAVSTLSAPAQMPPREVPARTIPVPETVSPQMQKLIAAPLTPTWNVIPQTPEAWKAQVNAVTLEASTRTRTSPRPAVGRGASTTSSPSGSPKRPT